ncbi:uncharacterized protein BDW70DRAFT_103720 [Aspergillus foveolatus]|uniref:uncharacterized protein n=1 Tax=Aspergillus foveolatus TaxID=210207 RepID=UPI003CCDF99D
MHVNGVIVGSLIGDLSHEFTNSASRSCCIGGMIAYLAGSTIYFVWTSLMGKVVDMPTPKHRRVSKPL